MAYDFIPLVDTSQTHLRSFILVPFKDGTYCITYFELLQVFLHLFIFFDSLFGLKMLQAFQNF